MPELDTVVLDIGNVLLRFSPDDIARRLVGGSDDNIAALLHAVFDSPIWPLLDRGVIEPDEAARHMQMAARGAIREQDALTIITRFYETLEPLPLVQALPDIKARGFKLYALTNYPRQAFADTRARFKFFDLFDGIVVSSHEKMCKPEPGIYRTLLSRYSVAPEKAVFVDDNWDNVVGAMTLGIRGYHYREGISNEVFLASL